MLADADTGSDLDLAAKGVEMGLHYVAPGEPGISRRRSGRGFTYRRADGTRIVDLAVLRRIRALAIPPAWRDVWICPTAEGHIQAFGFDERGRKQYRYHAAFRQIRDDAKFQRLLDFGEALPALRRRVTADMGKRGLGRDKVLATVVHLLETTMIRVGNETYARQNQSYGLTTLSGEHVEVAGATLKFEFKGKSGKMWRLDVRDRRVARIVRACQQLPGQHLFSYLDEDGHCQTVTSQDVNHYLRDITGRDITAKDFRTWAGTVLTFDALAEMDAAGGQLSPPKVLRQVIKRVAGRLGNTPAVCRASYIHPELIEAYLKGELQPAFRDCGPLDAESADALRPDETTLLCFLRRHGSTRPADAQSDRQGVAA